MSTRVLDRRLADVEQRLARLRPELLPAGAGDWESAWLKFCSTDELIQLERIVDAEVRGDEVSEADQARRLAIEASAIAKMLNHLEGSHR